MAKISTDDILEKIELHLGEYYDPHDEDYYTMLIDSALNTVSRAYYPWGFKDKDSRDKIYRKVMFDYEDIIIEAVISAINKRGWEGEISHHENGTIVTFESGSIVPPSLLKRVKPVARIIS